MVSVLPALILVVSHGAASPKARTVLTGLECHFDRRRARGTVSDDGRFFFEGGDYPYRLPTGKAVRRGEVVWAAESKPPHVRVTTYTTSQYGNRAIPRAQFDATTFLHAKNQWRFGAAWGGDRVVCDGGDLWTVDMRSVIRFEKRGLDANVTWTIPRTATGAELDDPRILVPTGPTLRITFVSRDVLEDWRCERDRDGAYWFAAYRADLTKPRPVFSPVRRVRGFDVTGKRGESLVFDQMFDPDRGRVALRSSDTLRECDFTGNAVRTAPVADAEKFELSFAMRRDPGPELSSWTVLGHSHNLRYWLLESKVRKRWMLIDARRGR